MKNGWNQTSSLSITQNLNMIERNKKLKHKLELKINNTCLTEADPGKYLGVLKDKNLT